jgi:Tol biopolymer transport system component
VAFESSATNLVAAGGDMLEDIYVHERETGITTRVSENTMGDESDGFSLDPSISANGQYVAFLSDATDLVAGDTNGKVDIFVHDRQTGETTRVSVDSGGAEGDDISTGPSISSDGRYVAFESIAADLVAPATNGNVHIFVRDLLAGTTTLVSVDSTDVQGNDDSSSASISADGRYVAFESIATNLVPGGSNGSIHVFVHDRDADGNGIYDEPGGISTVQASVDSAGNQGNGHSYAPSISADGRYVAFNSEADDLVAGDTKGLSDIFVHDLLLGTTRRVGVSSTGAEAEGGDSSSPSYSADGQYVAFGSQATNLVAGSTNGSPHVFIRESMPPTITSTGPTDSTTDVAVDADITATFSEEMDASTINGTTFTLDNGATGTVAYDANSDSAILTPTGKLDYDTTYTATVTTQAEDVAGNALQANHSWSFTTQSEGNSGGDSGGGGCFIATAADGSRMAGEVK